MFPAMSLSATDRLRRTKSSRSIRRSHQTSFSGEPFDPEIAKQHATVAASLAMQRSTERSSTDSQRSYDRLGGPGSMAVPQRHRPSGDTESSKTGSIVTVSRSQLSTARVSENNNNDQLSAAALPPISEFGGLDGRRSSLPSSYRRLRKSRSMFATGQRYSRISYGVPSRLHGYATMDSYRNLMAQGRTRSLSSSIKRGIKRVFGLSKSVAENSHIQTSPVDQKQCPTLPTISNKDGDCSAGNDHNAVCPERLADSSHPQTLRNTPSSESLATSRSRVTSWADSTVANTIVMRKAGDQSHLDIIDERDLRPNLSLLTPSNSPREECSSISEPDVPERSIDGQRQSRTQDTEEIVLGQVREHRAVPMRASSLHPHSSRQTIRRVPSNGSITSPGSYATAPGGMLTPQKRPAVLSIQNAPEDDSRDIFGTERQGVDTSSSPSIYSRTTSGNSPATQNRKSEVRSPEPRDEPGVATIYESQRSAYSSPKRNVRLPPSEIQARASADWQQWMQSQMARIENLTPTREHYREHAQIYDHAANVPRPRRFLSREKQADSGTLASEMDNAGHDGLFSSGELTCKIGTESNFSRPFSRSPSIRTLVTVSKEHPSSAAASFSIPISVSPNTGDQSSSVDRTRVRVDQNTLSPMQYRPINRPWMPDSPTPKRGAREMSQRLTLSGKCGRSSAKWSPAQDIRVAPIRSGRHRDSIRLTNENLRTNNGHGNSKEPYILSQDSYTPISSKRMVEMFLSSRRQQMGTEMSDDSAPDGAFL
ncbi:uncharacterized protein BDW43DRAFT_298564 [Aspergillus alliaceus]|uniref:uncharacterized protein n=1 Tax=Petromyces alliaceus TaxID=209559 RepID=UPI0012A41E62|nr:uncharacterized protein BDW43DRAFT_298564 [Aspergillus alliaceus]KAB8235982.1 hypothetical protein BDW43DRAFT_298564 [Aspergillus alliaceus]